MPPAKHNERMWPHLEDQHYPWLKAKLGIADEVFKNWTDAALPYPKLGMFGTGCSTASCSGSLAASGATAKARRELGISPSLTTGRSGPTSRARRELGICVQRMRQARRTSPRLPSSGSAATSPARSAVGRLPRAWPAADGIKQQCDTFGTAWARARPRRRRGRGRRRARPAWRRRALPRALVRASSGTRCGEQRRARRFATSSATCWRTASG